jgi:flagellar motility protein MotE (MotC chaperone)
VERDRVLAAQLRAAFIAAVFLVLVGARTVVAGPISKATDSKVDAKAPEKIVERPATSDLVRPAIPEAPPAKVGAVEKGGDEGKKKVAGAPEKMAGASVREKSKGASSSANKKSPPQIGEEDSPASPPPLDINGLRAEIRRESPPAIGIDAPEYPETKVEKMLTEVTRAREALRDDTQRLEALMAQDNEPSAEGGAGATGKPAAKNPLDILAKALRGIKPDQSAPIVSRLDRHLGAVVLQRMPPVDAGKILGAMKPETAAELATLIALRRPAAEARAEVKR